MRYFVYKDRMKILLAALLLFSLQAQAATFESLTEKTLREGTITETAFGITKSLDRRMGSVVVYFTLAIDSQSGQPKSFTGVIEDWQKTPEGKFQINQTLLYFTPVGELAVTGRFKILLKKDKSFESREEISYGEPPLPQEVDQWNEILASW